MAKGIPKTQRIMINATMRSTPFDFLMMTFYKRIGAIKRTLKSGCTNWVAVPNVKNKKKKEVILCCGMT